MFRTTQAEKRMGDTIMIITMVAVDQLKRRIWLGLHV
jgi:hypothetical protein